MLPTYTKSKRKLTSFSGKSVGGRPDLRQSCLAELKSILKVDLARNKPTLYSNTNAKVGVFCALSKGRPWNAKTEYWFAFSLSQKKFLKQFKNKYLAFICGPYGVLLIPFSDIKTTQFDSSGKLHIHIMKEGHKFIMSSTGVELTQYMIPKKNNYISNLNPGGKKDFWAFYKQNGTAIEDVITAQIFRYAPYLNRYDREDLHQDILLRMHRCNILGQYNPALSAFNTYLTGHVYDM